MDELSYGPVTHFSRSQTGKTGGTELRIDVSVLYDVVIIGGGIIGLATARELALRYPRLRLALLEKELDLAAHQTGRNSGVIHSGLYYKPGSLKARLCVEGRRLLWQYCDERRIEYRNVGKLVVATQPRELPLLESLYARGQANEIEGLVQVDEGGIREREPYCRGIRAIFSPITGIIDYTLVARSFAHDVMEAGGDVLTGREVTAIVNERGSVRVDAGDSVHARYVITCGGLFSDRLSRMTGGPSDPKIVPFRGDYLILKPEKRYLVRGNIYPVPDPSFPFLGVHFTPRMNGDIWLGPNAVLAFAREGYSFSRINVRDLVETALYPGFLKLASKHARTGLGEMYRDLWRPAYVRALQRYIPDLQPDDTMPGPSGVRAQAMLADGTQLDDFAFEGDGRTLHVRNAPSPAATSSMAIAKHIADDAARRFALRSPL